MTLAEITAQVADLVEARGPRIVGIGGSPGSGKTTLARSVADALRDRGRRPVCTSLDDFCYPRSERERRGIGWRAMPGSHDLGLLIATLRTVRSGDAPLTLPRYSPEIDDRIEPVTVVDAPDPMLLDGWLLGSGAEGYQQIREHLDMFVFLDAPIDIARARRFSREEKLRAGGGGFDNATMQAFWDEVLEPGIREHIPTAKANADVVLSVED